MNTRSAARLIVLSALVSCFAASAYAQAKPFEP
jgi:hypothetical protein